MRILFYGDSNTWGYDAQSGLRYTDRFTALIQKACLEDEIIEEGLCGRTICHEDPYSFEQRNGTKTVSMVIKTHVPLDLIVIMLGTNDAKRVYGTNAASSIEKGMDMLLHEVMDPENYKHASKKPKILVLCPPKMHPGFRDREFTWANFSEEGYRIIENMKEPLKRVCEKWKVDFYDLEDVVAGEFDALHLDLQGHQKIAEKLIPKLGEYR